MRQPDASLLPDERLFRSVSADHVDGDRILSAAVKLPATSCDREAYAAPESVLVPGRPGDTCVAMMRVDAVPAPRVSPGGTAYDWIAADDPRPHNEAHAEVRLRRESVYDPAHQPSSKAFRELLRGALAEPFRVVIAPK